MPTVSVAHMMVPRSAVKIYRNALSPSRTEKYNEVAAATRQPLCISSRNTPMPLALRGLLELGSADIADAQHSFEEAIRIDPSESAAYVALAQSTTTKAALRTPWSPRKKDSLSSRMRGRPISRWPGPPSPRECISAGLKFLRQAERLGGNAFAEVHLIKAYALMPLKLYQDAKYELQASLASGTQGRDCAGGRAHACAA